MHFLPWWALLTCLAPAALAAYLLLGRTQAGDFPWALFALTAIAAPVVLTGAMAAAVVLSTLLSAALEDRAAPPAGPPAALAQAERTGAGATTERTELEATSGRASPATGGPSASPGASPAASSSVSASP